MILLETYGIRMVFGKFAALKGVDLTIEANEFHGLIGPNGSGKTTLLNCIAGAVVPTAGTVRFLSNDITAMVPADRATAGLSIKFQITSILPSLTVYDNVLLALQAQTSMRSLMMSQTRKNLHDRIIGVLEQFNLNERANEPAGILSHGEQQWLEIGMALASEPKLLLLDEPTAGMSPEERRLTGQLLAPLKQKCSLVIVEHDLDFVKENCDTLTVLDQGEVLAQGASEEIEANPLVQEIYVTRV